MNTALMTQIQTLIYSNQDRLEALVEALEGVCKEGNTEVSPTPKHPLINYTVSEKDIGSLVKLWDTTEAGAFMSILTSIDKEKVDLHYGNKDAWWDNAKPFTDTIKLHFHPFVATENSEMPSELEYPAWVAVLLANGVIDISEDASDFIWRSGCEFDIVGYQILSFVNPILDK
jgi:hypothetical protein